MLRYSNGDILSTLNTSGEFIMSNTSNVTRNQIEFKDLVLSAMNQTATMASNSSQKFDARKAYFNAFQDLYALVQCTPDLTSQECFHCLNWTINRLPIHRVGGRIFVPSCNSRFELYSFYNESAVPTSQQQLDSAPPPPPQISIPSPLPGPDILYSFD